MTISQLFVYPIKSCRGSAVAESVVTRRGLKGDREWMLVDETGRFLSQREHPKLAQIVPTLTHDGLVLSAPEMPALAVPVIRGAACRVVVWSSDCDAEDQGDAAAQWCSAFLGLHCRLVRIADDFLRPLSADYRTNTNDTTAFADAYPILVLSEASLADLNQRIGGAPLTMDRFRPNIVVSGCQPYAEDNWRTIQLGALTLAIVKPCDRCAVTTIDQATLERGKEPLATLSTYRRWEKNGKVIFGQNAIPQGAESHTITLGTEVLVVR